MSNSESTGSVLKQDAKTALIMRKLYLSTHYPSLKGEVSLNVCIFMYIRDIRVNCLVFSKTKKETAKKKKNLATMQTADREEKKYHLLKVGGHIAEVRKRIRRLIKSSQGGQRAVCNSFLKNVCLNYELSFHTLVKVLVERSMSL